MKPEDANKHILKKLRDATCPEDVFGKIDTAAELKATYRILSRRLHPDVNKCPGASEAFAIMAEWYERGRKKLADGTYGKVETYFKLHSKLHNVQITGVIAEGSISTVYRGTIEGGPHNGKDAVVKLVRNPRNNDLMLAEAKNVTEMRKRFVADFGEDIYELNMVPPAIYSSEAQIIHKKGAIGRVASVIPIPDGSKKMFTLQQVKDAYPNGVDPRDAAWMFNRLLSGLAVAHWSGYVHGSVLSQHLIINPETHWGCVIGWPYSVKTGERLKAYESRPTPEWYPREVLSKEPVTCATDIYMAANVLEWLCAKPMPVLFESFILACRMHQTRRPQNAGEAQRLFSDLLTSLWGGRKFHKFTMPG